MSTSPHTSWTKKIVTREPCKVQKIYSLPLVLLTSLSYIAMLVFDVVGFSKLSTARLGSIVVAKMVADPPDTSAIRTAARSMLDHFPMREKQKLVKGLGSGFLFLK